MSSGGWRAWGRGEDLAWVALFGALWICNPVHSTPATVLLACLLILQILEPRLAYLATPQGRILAIFLKLILGYLLVGVTGGVTSSFYLILLLPVLSAATSLSALGTGFFAVLCSAAYLSFLSFIDWSRFTLPPEQMRELALRLIFLAFISYLAHTVSGAYRREAKRYQMAAEQLAEANRNLQRAEEAYRRSERLAALGQLSAGLAHELRNPLSTMKASAQMLAQQVAQENEIAREMAGFIGSEVDRINSLITRFLQFARPVALKKERGDLAACLDRAVEQVSRDAAPCGVSIFKNYAPEIPPLVFDAELMERVFYNLILNAVQASPPSGAVTVKTRLAGKFAEIAVIDRGSGIAPEIREQIFNPFFTTKSSGVGLGLPIVAKIVDEHGGTITVESEPGRGSVFRVFLPLPEKPAA